MKKILFVWLAVAAVGLSCNQSPVTNQKTNLMEETTIKTESPVFPKGDAGSADYFKGTVFVQPLVSPDEVEGLYSVGNVTFEPGGRTNWHTHPIGQVLLITEGKGFYQERGKPAQELTKGSVVAIPKDVEHWHGAAGDTKLVHIAISNMVNGSNVTWMTPVTDEEYGEVNH